MFKEVPMNFKIDYLGVNVDIDTGAKQISIIQDNTNSKELFNMVFKAILNKVNINVNDYKIINKIK